MKRAKIFATSLIAGFLLVSAAHAGPWGWSVGVRIGAPCYYPRPWYPYWGVYVRPYPIYVAPGPVVYEAAPVVVQPTPVVMQPAPVSGNVAAYTTPPISTPTPSSAPAIATAGAQGDASKRQASVDYNLQMLRSAEEGVRRYAAMELGRMKAHRAVDPLTATLAGDRSPVVREAAARALALIGDQKSLTALIRAAQVDSDRDVRHSAQFAVEVIRTNLKN